VSHLVISDEGTLQIILPNAPWLFPSTLEFRPWKKKTSPYLVDPKYDTIAKDLEEIKEVPELRLKDDLS
jgi:hypothetical protein